MAQARTDDTSSSGGSPCSEVLRTSEFVNDHQSSVVISQPKIMDFVKSLEAKIVDSGGKFVWDKWADYHLTDMAKYTLEQVTAYCFVTDAMNFCFWPDNPAGEFEYEHMTRNLEKVLDSDPDFFTVPRLASVTEAQIRELIFAGNLKFGLVDERARLVRQLGLRLQEASCPDFLTFMRRHASSDTSSSQEVAISCPRLVKAIIDTFEGFRD